MSTPFTYLIGWTHHDKWYYGVRYGKSADPADLWTTYFTSSKYVRSFIEEFGEPDIIQIRKIFDSSQRARLWESALLKRIKAVQSDKWLNKSASDGSFFATAEHLANLAISNRGRTLSEAHRKKLSDAGKGKPKSQSHKIAIGRSLVGKVRPTSVRQKISNTRKERGIRSSTDHMNSLPFYCSTCDKTMTKGNFVRWHSKC